MRRLILTTAGLAALLLAGCEKKDERPASGPLLGPRARYAALGVYAPGEVWRLQKPLTAEAPSDPAAARLDDDDAILVVLDSATGEVRQCGNVSGRCLTMNPWTRPVDGATSVPAALTQHRLDWAQAPATVRRKPD